MRRCYCPLRSHSPLGVAQTTKDIRRCAEAAKWRVVLAGSGHWKMYAPDGKTIVTVESTPSDHRAIKNTLSRLKRHGLRC